VDVAPLRKWTERNSAHAVSRGILVKADEGSKGQTDFRLYVGALLPNGGVGELCGGEP